MLFVVVRACPVLCVGEIHGDASKVTDFARSVAADIIAHPATRGVIAANAGPLRELLPGVGAQQLPVPRLGSSLGLFPAMAAKADDGFFSALDQAKQADRVLNAELTQSFISELALSAAMLPEAGTDYIFPDGSVLPSLMSSFLLVADPHVGAALYNHIGAVRVALLGIVEKLYDAKVPVDPQGRSPVDFLVVAQLALFDVDWEMAPDVIAARLNVGMTFTLDPQGSALKRWRPGASDDLERTAGRIRRSVQEMSNPSVVAALRPKASHGGHRAARANQSRQRQRRDAVRQAIETFPKVAALSNRSAAQRIRTTWGRPGTVGGAVADMIDANCPSLATMQADIAVLRKKVPNLPLRP